LSTAGRIVIFGKMKQDLVLGCVQNYQWPQISPFVNSLLDCGFQGEIYLLTRGIDASTASEMRRRNVTLRPMTQKTSTRAIHPRSRYWRKSRFAPMWFRRWLFKRYCSLSSLRHFEYQKFLRQHGAEYRQIFIVDVGDVVFQSKPFSDPPAQGLHCFEEWAGHTLASEPCNAWWLATLFGPDVLKELGAHPILCAGSILGDPASLLDLFDKTTRTLPTVRAILEAGDQACFNLTVRREGGPGVHIHKNGDTVLTMGIMPETEIHLNPAGQVVDAGNRVIPVLHQFNRHPAWREKIAVLKKWLPEPV
jgi:hypothetical protein